MDKELIQRLTQDVHEIVKEATTVEGDRKSADQWTEIYKAQIETTGRITAALIGRGLFFLKDKDQEGS